MGVVVTARGVGLVGFFRAWHKDEGVRAGDEIRTVILELHVLDGQSLCAGGATLAVDDDLSGDGLVFAINGQVQTCLLVDDAVAGDVVNQLDGHVARHLVGGVQGSLKRHVLGLANLGDILRLHPLSG